MARIVKEYEARRSEILDAALRLVYTKGYEQMTIQDILDALQISKGAFYHYFDSKQALLDALVDRMVNEALHVLRPILEDPALPATDKLQRFFQTAALWKTTQKEFILALLQVWYTDGNALPRQKQITAALRQVAPLLTQIIQQGAREGAFHTAFPDQAGEVILSLLQNAGDTMAGLILVHDPSSDALQRMESYAAAYNDAVERVLGTLPGSLQLIDPKILKVWVAAPEEVAGVND